MSKHDGDEQKRDSKLKKGSKRGYFGLRQITPPAREQREPFAHANCLGSEVPLSTRKKQSYTNS